MSQECFCRSGKPFDQCCAPIISGNKAAQTAEQLMRSRYSAYCTKNIDYLYNTTHPAHRPVSKKGIEDWANSSNFYLLIVHSATLGGKHHETGVVSFSAYYTNQNKEKKKHFETSSFKKKNGKWFYVEAIEDAIDLQKELEKATVKNPYKIELEPIEEKTGRNAPCACGSGKKFKKCCGLS